MAMNEKKNPGRSLETGAKIGIAAAYKNPKAAPSTILYVIDFYRTVNCLYLEEFRYIHL